MDAADLRPFLSLRFTGTRFDADPGMPIEMLGELVAYRDLLAEVARIVYLRDNPARQRVPKGFTDRLQLRLRRVEEGSAVPVLERPVGDGTMVAVADEFDAARDLISGAIAAADGGVGIPQGFPPAALVYFNRFGQGLLDDESIELRTDGSGVPPRYTQRTRKALLAGRAHYQRDAVATGWVTEVDTVRMRFHLTRPDESSVPAPLDDVTIDDVKGALTQIGEGSEVTVSGVGVFDMSDRLIRFDSVHELVPVEDEVAEAIGIAQVAEGWLDGIGAATDRLVLERARVVLGSLVDRGLPLPKVYPVPDGGVQAEWSSQGREVSVTVETGGSIYVIAVNTVSGESEDALVEDSETDRIVRLVLPDAS